MTYKPHKLLGTISKISGYDGFVALRLEQDFIGNIPEMESVFIEVNGVPVPFFISALDYRGSNILRVKFDGYESIDKIEEFTGARVYLTSSDETSALEEQSYNLEGFRVEFPDSESLGTIDSIIEHPGQNLLRIISLDGREILVPLHADLIISIDPDQKLVIVSLPEGLSNLN